MQKYRILACLEESLRKFDFEEGSKVYRCLVTFRPKDFAGGSSGRSCPCGSDADPTPSTDPNSDLLQLSSVSSFWLVGLFA
jgi:hypothetical protein